jgi:protocatechuate 3,4-dioxygenase beta subunit
MNARRFFHASIPLFAVLTITSALFAQTGSIQGFVVRGTNDPLSKARVELRRDNPDTGVLDSVVTEQDGAFVFRNVQPGRYRIAVTRQGYLRPPLTVDVQAGQPMVGLQLPMTTTGAIYGMVFDEQGNPFGNVNVQALKASYAGGRRVLTPVQSVRTNDAGEYRLFWLAPGRYYIAAVPPQAASVQNQIFTSVGMSMLGGPQSFQSRAEVDPALGIFGDVQLGLPSGGDRWAPIYFSNVFDEQAASAIDLRAGADYGAVNITVTPVQPRHVRGIVLDENGRAPNSPFVAPVLNDPATGVGTQLKMTSGGGFDITILPGSYLIKASADGKSGFAAVRVAETDVENVVIRVQGEFNIKGRITVEGRPISASDLGTLRLTMVRDLPGNPSSGSYSVPLPDGSITLGAGGGDFRLNVAPILVVNNPRPPGGGPTSLRDAYVKSMRLGDVDVLNAGFHLQQPTDARLEIVIGTNPGTVDGVVAGDAQQPVTDMTVVLVPNVRLRTDLYKTATTDPSGRFRFDRVPPGEYKIFAWSEVDNGAWFDPEFIGNYEGRGQAVVVEEGKTASVSLQMIPLR